MTAVAYRFRAELRRRWVAWTAIAVLLGIAGGLVLALVAGARRTDSAYDRFLEEHAAYDVLLISGIPDLFEFAPLDLEAIAASDEVSDSTPLHVVATTGWTPDGILLDPGSVNFGADPTNRYGRELNRFKVLEGRMPDPERPEELAVSFVAAETLSLELGDSFDVNVLTFDEAGTMFSGQASMEELAGQGPLQRLEVVAIVAEPNGFPPPSDPTVDLGFLHYTPALLEQNPDAMVVESLAVRLDGGPGAATEFVDSLQRDAGDLPVATARRSLQTEAVRRGMAPLSRSLLVTGLLAAVVALLVAGQVLVRQASAESGDLPALRALGMTRGGRLLLRTVKATGIGFVAAIVAVASAVLASASFPISLARLAEPDPGIDVDAFVLGVGAVGVFLAVVGLGALAAWLGGLRYGRDRLDAGADVTVGRRAGPIARGLRALARGPASIGGTSLLTGQRGAAGAVGGVAIGVLTVIGILTFSASLDRLRDTPALYGWSWDLTIGGDFGEPLDPDGLDAVAAEPRVRSIEVGAFVDLVVGGDDVRAMALDPLVGAARPAMLEGRPAEGRGEIVLGAHAVSDVRIGDLTEITFGDRTAEVELVGRAALPEVDALVPFATVQELSPETSPQLVAITLVDGVDADEFGAGAAGALGLTDQSVLRPSLPQDVENFGRADDTPTAMAALMVLVAGGTLLHALLTAVQRGRRPLAVLRTIGFTRRQLLGSVLWQAGLLVLAALVAAVPLGVAIGSWTWRVVSDELGVVPATVVPVAGVVVVTVVAIVMALVVAGAPGLRASRIAPAGTLRAD